MSTLSLKFSISNDKYEIQRPKSPGSLAGLEIFQAFPATALNIQTEISFCQDENFPFLQA